MIRKINIYLFIEMEIKTLQQYNSINNIDYGDKIVIYKFGADWCTPCINLNKEFESINDCIIYNISIDNEEFNSFFIDNKIYTIPDTFIKYKSKFDRFIGFKTNEEIKKLIELLHY